MKGTDFINWLFAEALAASQRPAPQTKRVNGHHAGKIQRDRKAHRAKARHKGRMARLSRQRNRHAR